MVKGKVSLKQLVLSIGYIRETEVNQRVPLTVSTSASAPRRTNRSLGDSCARRSIEQQS